MSARTRLCSWSLIKIHTLTDIPCCAAERFGVVASHVGSARLSWVKLFHNGLIASARQTDAVGLGGKDQSITKLLACIFSRPEHPTSIVVLFSTPHVAAKEFNTRC